MLPLYKNNYNVSHRGETSPGPSRNSADAVSNRETLLKFERHAQLQEKRRRAIPHIVDFLSVCNRREKSKGINPYATHVLLEYFKVYTEYFLRYGFNSTTDVDDSGPSEGLLKKLSTIIDEIESCRRDLLTNGSKLSNEFEGAHACKRLNKILQMMLNEALDPL